MFDTAKLREKEKKKKGTKIPCLFLCLKETVVVSCLFFHLGKSCFLTYDLRASIIYSFSDLFVVPIELFCDGEWLYLMSCNP